MDSKQETTSKEDKDDEQGNDEKNLDFIGDFLNVEPPEGSLDVGFIWRLISFVYLRVKLYAE